MDVEDVALVPSLQSQAKNILSQQYGKAFHAKVREIVDFKLLIGSAICCCG